MSDESLEVHADIAAQSDSGTFGVDTINQGELKLVWQADPDGYFPNLTFSGDEFTINITMPQGMSPEELGEWITEKAQEMPKETRC